MANLKTLQCITDTYWTFLVTHIRRPYIHFFGGNITTTPSLQTLLIHPLRAKKPSHSFSKLNVFCHCVRCRLLVKIIQCFSPRQSTLENSCSTFLLTQLLTTIQECQFCLVECCCLSLLGTDTAGKHLLRLSQYTDSIFSKEKNNMHNYMDAILLFL